MATVEECVKWYTDRGYCGISNQHKIVARIDDGLWMHGFRNRMFLTPDGFADHWRRHISKDRIEGVDPDVYKRLPNSSHCEVYYRPLPWPALKTAPPQVTKPSGVSAAERFVVTINTGSWSSHVRPLDVDVVSVYPSTHYGSLHGHFVTVVFDDTFMWHIPCGTIDQARAIAKLFAPTEPVKPREPTYCEAQATPTGPQLRVDFDNGTVAIMGCSRREDAEDLARSIKLKPSAPAAPPLPGIVGYGLWSDNCPTDCRRITITFDDPGKSLVHATTATKYASAFFVAIGEKLQAPKQ